jgi:hypothetical protein
VTVEYHWLEGQYDRMPALLTDLVRRQVSVIATPGPCLRSLAIRKARGNAGQRGFRGLGPRRQLRSIGADVGSSCATIRWFVVSTALCTRPSTLCQIMDVSFGGSGASRVDTWVGGHVLDLAMRNADIFQVTAIQAVQGGPHLLAFASFLDCIPASPDETRDLPVRHGRLS